MVDQACRQRLRIRHVEALIPVAVEEEIAPVFGAGHRMPIDDADIDAARGLALEVENGRVAFNAGDELLAVVMQSDKSAQQDVQTPSVSPALTPALSGGRSRPPDMMTTASTSAMAAPAAPTDYAANPVQQDNKARGLRISSDLSTNSIVVTATPAEWRIIEAALRRLDVMPPQVLIEATIAEVTLNDALQHGVNLGQCQRTELFGHRLGALSLLIADGDKLSPGCPRGALGMPWPYEAGPDHGEPDGVRCVRHSVLPSRHSTRHPLVRSRTAPDGA